MRLFIGNLAYATTEDELRDFFDEDERITVVDAMIPGERESNKLSKGFGFIEIKTHLKFSDVREKYHRAWLNGRQMIVDKAKPRPPRPSDVRRDETEAGPRKRRGNYR